MKRLLWTFLPILIVTVISCRDEDGMPSAQHPELYLLEGDSIALCHISESFKTTSANYPHPWSVSDRSSWKGSIELDTIIDSETDEAALTVGALTLYIPEPADPMNEWLLRLQNVRDFKLYACPEATFIPECIPIGCDSILVDKIDSTMPGYIKVPNKRWDTATYMYLNNWIFSKIEIHNLDINFINFWASLTGTVDLSGNCLEGRVDQAMGDFQYKVNLSHNNYTEMMGTWKYWESGRYNVPDLRYNDIPIPEEILATDFWRKNHELFIGNPGYQAPK